MRDRIAKRKSQNDSSIKSHGEESHGEDRSGSRSIEQWEDDLVKKKKVKGFVVEFME